MADASLDPLVLDLIEWVMREPRTYAETIETWRTSCPRLTVWEDAVDRGLVERKAQMGSGPLVVVTDAGRLLLSDRLLSDRRRVPRRAIGIG